MDTMDKAQLSHPVVFKVTLGDDTRRWTQYEAFDYEELRSKVVEMFDKLKDPSKLTMRYTDGEGDKITLASEDDLSELFLSFGGNPGASVRLTVEKPKGKGKSSSQSSSEPTRMKEGVRSPKEPRGAPNATSDEKTPEVTENKKDSFGIKCVLSQLRYYLPLMSAEQSSCEAALSLMHNAWSMPAELSERVATFVWERCEKDPNIMEAIQALATTGTVPRFKMDGQHRSSFSGAQSLASRALKPHKAIHRTIICDGCEKTPIVGLRYKSLSRNNFDVCSDCHAKKDALWAMDTFVVLPYPRALEDLARAHPEKAGQAEQQRPNPHPHPHPDPHHHPNPHPHPRPHPDPHHHPNPHPHPHPHPDPHHPHHRRCRHERPRPPPPHNPHHHDGPPPHGPPHHPPHGPPHRGPHPPPLPPFSSLILPYHLPPHDFPGMYLDISCPPSFGFSGPHEPPGMSLSSLSQHDYSPPQPPPPHSLYVDMLLDAAFVRDVTVPDNTKVAPGQAFTKTWRIRNSGLVPWGSLSSNEPHQKQGLLLLHVDGNVLGAAEATPLDLTAAKDEEYDVKVSLKAPEARGVYTGYFRLAFGSIDKSHCFGPAIWACVEVTDDASDDEVLASHGDAAEEKEWLPVSGASAAEADDDFHEVNKDDEFHDAVPSSAGFQDLLTGVAGIKILPADEHKESADAPVIDAVAAEAAAGEAGHQQGSDELLGNADQANAGEPEGWVEVTEAVKTDNDKQN